MSIWQNWVPDQERVSSQAYLAAEEQARNILGVVGMMLSGSKSGYMKMYKKNLAVFNANVCSKELGKIWFGDLDLSKSENSLKALAKALNQTLYVISEHGARFDRENNPDFNDAILVVSPDGVGTLSEENNYARQFTRLKNGKIVRKTE